MEDSAEAHWEAVSRATQLEALRRREARRERRRRRRVRSGLLLVRAGLRLAEPLPVEGLFDAPR